MERDKNKLMDGIIQICGRMPSHVLKVVHDYLMRMEKAYGRKRA